MKKFVLALLAVVLVLGLCTVASAECITAASEHHNTTWDRTTSPATCEKDAVWYLKCADCGKYVNANGKAVADKSAAKQEVQYGTASLELCVAGDEQVYDSTCYKTGTVVRSCKDCGRTLLEETIEKKEHAPYADGELKHTAATCGKNAQKSYVCKHCGDTIIEEEMGTALTHNYKKDVLLSKDASCTEDGNKYEKCEICGDVKNVGIPMFNHMKNGVSAYAKTGTKVAATCTEGGIDIHTCSLCQATKEVPTAKLNHDMSEWHIDVAPTCTKPGVESRYCLRVGCKNPVNGQAEREFREIPALDHDYAWGVLTPAECGKPGVESAVCENCGANTTRPIAAKEHDVKTWTEDAALNIRYGTCTLCKTTVVEALVVAPETPADPEVPGTEDKPAEDKPAEDEKDDNNSEGTGSTTGNGSDASIPATGDNGNTMAYIMMVVAAAGLVVLAASKRKVNC